MDNNKPLPVDEYNKALEEFLTPEELAVVKDMRANVQIKDEANYVRQPIFEPVTSYELPETMMRVNNIKARLTELQKGGQPLHLLPGQMESFFKLDVEKKRSPSLEFCDLLRESGNITAACAKLRKHYPSIKLTPKAIEDYRVLIPAFSESVDLALDLFRAKLEEAAIERAVDGVDEPVFYQGVECGSKKKYSDDLLKFLMTANDSGKYGKAEGKAGNAPIVVQIANFTQSADYGGDNGLLTMPDVVINQEGTQTDE